MDFGEPTLRRISIGSQSNGCCMFCQLASFRCGMWQAQAAYPEAVLSNWGNEASSEAKPLFDTEDAKFSLLDASKSSSAQTFRSER